VAKLSEEQIVTIRVLHEQGEPASVTARRFGLSEGTVRYHRRRGREGFAVGGPDGRAKVHLIQQRGLVEAVDQWWSAQQAERPERPPSVTQLLGYLQSEFGYPGSYKSVRLYVRKRFPPPRRRPYRRIETPPGAQAQTDWAEQVPVDIGDPAGPTVLHALVMSLSHSRKQAVIWSRSMDQLAWHRCHNEALKRLGGVPALNRIDNVKTGVARGAGPWGQLNQQYRAYARALGFHAEACEPYQPQQKGKAERSVDGVKRLPVHERCFDGLDHLQRWTDAKLEASAKRRICPATGTSVHEAWQREKAQLRALPEVLPEPFDLVQQRPVHADCTVRFEGRQYTVPFAYVGKRVEVRGCSGVVQVADAETGRVIQQHPRGTARRLVLDETCYEGPGTDEVIPPRPLGRMSQKLQELAEQPVQRRAVDYYAELAEVAR
jgi:transposase